MTSHEKSPHKPKDCLTSHILRYVTEDKPFCNIISRPLQCKTERGMSVY